MNELNEMAKTIYDPPETVLPDDMVLQWRHFAKIVEHWIVKHGRDEGYTLKSGLNTAEIFQSPIGWLQHAAKYAIELYTLIDRGNTDATRQMKLCWKIAHCAQLSFSRIVGDMNVEEKPEWA